MTMLRHLENQAKKIKKKQIAETCLVRAVYVIRCRNELLPVNNSAFFNCQSVPLMFVFFQQWFPDVVVVVLKSSTLCE